MSEKREFDITFSMPLFSQGWIIQVRVLHEDNLAHQDEGRLCKLTARRRCLDGAADMLKMTQAEKDSFTLEFESQWLAFYQRLMTERQAGPSQANAAMLLQDMPEETRLAAEEFLGSPDLVKRICTDLGAIGIAGESDLALTLYLVGVSRLLDRPLSARVHGHTASGKSYIIETVFSLFPPETCIAATQLTPQSLYHLPAGSLRHAIVVAGERSRRTSQGAADETRALREMQASGTLTKLRVRRNGDTEWIEQEGPISYVESTTLRTSDIFDEDLNRCLVLQTDERAEQTQRILKQTAGLYSGKAAAADRSGIVDVHHAAQRMLQPYRVEVPFAEQLADALDSNQIEARRVFSQILSTIQAVTVLHQFQREEAGQGLVATVEDYAVARRLLVGPVKKLLGGGLSADALALHHRLRAAGQDTFTTTEACRAQKKTRQAVNACLHELVKARAVKVLTKGTGRRPDTWRLTGRDPADADLLPSVDDIARNSGAQRHNAERHDMLRLPPFC